jgi:hypothetical protein
MAKHIVQFEKVTIGGVDLSDHIESLTASEKFDDNDVSALGAKSHEHLLGLADPMITLNFYQDFAAAEVHATLGPLAGSNTPFPIVITADGRSSVSATNPKFTLQALLPNYDLIAGSIGKPSMTSITFVCGDQNGIVESDS